MCQWALTEKGARGGALERGDGAALEGLKQLGDSLVSVGVVAVAIAETDIAMNFILVEAAEPVAIQAAKGEGGSVNKR